MFACFASNVQKWHTDSEQPLGGHLKFNPVGENPLKASSLGVTVAIRRSRLLLVSALFVLTALVTSAHARTILRNDSAEVGDMIAFYVQLQGSDAFTSIFEVPDEYDAFKVCRLLVWIGPAGFNVFTIRIAEADEDGNEIFEPAEDGSNGVDYSGLLWQSDLTAYQLFGREDELNAVDLAEEGIMSMARRIRVNMRHVEGQDAPPSIAYDTDGITPGRNQVLTFVRSQGRQVRFKTEDLEEGGRPERPAGDWIMRLEIAGLDEACPDNLAPMMELEPAPQPDEETVMPNMMDEADASVPSPPDMMDTPDMMDRPDEMDAALDDPPDAATPDASMTLSSEDDQSQWSGELEIRRIAPVVGPMDRNTDVIITGQGFVEDPPTVVRIDETRLLDVEFLSPSTLQAVVPAGLMPGIHDISVTRTSDGQTAILPGGFRISAGLTLVNIEPSQVSTSRATDVTIRGDGFAPGIRFQISETTLLNVTLNEFGVARATIPAGLIPGTYDLLALLDDEIVRLTDAVTVVGSPGAQGGCRTLDERSHAPSPLAILVCCLLFALRRRSS
ncbi:MAG: IPT/TIG domain-containing protein [Myxococcota bacterium]|nr:IPT/TIG domain-containing protein [Myxococcota bacterium]